MRLATTTVPSRAATIGLSMLVVAAYAPLPKVIKGQPPTIAHVRRAMQRINLHGHRATAAAAPATASPRTTSFGCLSLLLHGCVSVCVS
eukprot:m.230040 g.230040  ORF g.230040 m.230040 type:complete len:89 (+) comp18856_c4_seq4:1479-1745(+)